jgi:hypothetical protein
MRISHQHKFIFFAVPRTGSTTVRSVLDDFSDVRSVHITDRTAEQPFYHHISPRELVGIFESRGWDFDEYRKFCFVRNPFDRVVSLFHHRLRMIYGDDIFGLIRRRVKVAVHRRKRFRQFVENRIIGCSGRLEEPVSSFITNDQGVPLVDDVLPFEQISSRLPQYLEESFRLPVSAEDVPKKNSSSRLHYSEYYDDHARSIVRSTYKSDLLSFDYSF